MLNQLRKLAIETPPSRERYVDFLRAFSIVVVILGHWVTALIKWYPDGRIAGVYNAVGIIPWGWLVTWIFQVMPIFFFVGGFSNQISIEARNRQGESVSSFLLNRLSRILQPTIAFLAIWFVGYLIMRNDAFWNIPFLEATKSARTLWIIGIQPLWFLGVYIAIITLTPLLLELHYRYRLEVILLLVTLIAFVDMLRFGKLVPGVGWANFAFVWLLAHQLGFFYADGTLKKAPPRIFWFLAMGGLMGMIILTNIGIYPRSMVGTGFDEISNMSPPTVCIAMLIFWQIGLAMLLRAPMNRWLAKTKPWMAVILANWKIMTIYLWHLTAYALAFLFLHPLRWGKFQSTYAFWLERPVWVVVPSTFLIVLVILFGRFERTTGTSWVHSLRLFRS